MKRIRSCHCRLAFWKSQLKQRKMGYKLEDSQKRNIYQNYLSFVCTCLPHCRVVSQAPSQRAKWKLLVDLLLKVQLPELGDNKKVGINLKSRDSLTRIEDDYTASPLPTKITLRIQRLHSNCHNTLWRNKHGLHILENKLYTHFNFQCNQ